MENILLKSVNIDDLDKKSINPKTEHEAVSSYVIANYLFKNINERISFFKDINFLFNNYLTNYTKEYFATIHTMKSERYVTNLIKNNIKLVYKGGNIINYYILNFKHVFDKIGVDLKDELSDFDFSICVNYDFILDGLGIPKDDLNYIKLSKLADLVGFNIIKHFNNYMFCYQDDILKDSSINSTVKYPNTEYYKFGDIPHNEINVIFDFVAQYFSKIISAPKSPNINQVINEQIDNITNNKLSHNLEFLFDIVIQCAKTQICFIGFSLPTTFNKHKKIFNELEQVTADNSMKLSTFVLHLVSSIAPSKPDILLDDITLKHKFDINKKLFTLDERYDRIKTTHFEIYPSESTGKYCNFLPLKIADLYEKQINTLDGILTNSSESGKELNFKNFYHIKNDNLLLNEDIKYQHFIKTKEFDSIEYTNNYLNNYWQTHENMVTMSSNYSILFGTKNQNGSWSKITNFNLLRGKIPVRYYLKLDNSYTINGYQIKYLFVDYLGELIDLSIPTYGDSYYRNHFISAKPLDNTKFTSNFNIVKIVGTAISKKINITTYSLEYLINDLYEILFETEKGKPWEDIKYHKRIARIVKIYLAYLKNKYNSKQSLEMYNNFICQVEKAHLNFTETNNIDIDLLSIDNLDDMFKKFLAKLDKLSKKIITEADKDSMIKFLDFFICFLRPNPDCLVKFQPHSENIKPFGFLTKELTTSFLKKFTPDK